MTLRQRALFQELFGLEIREMNALQVERLVSDGVLVLPDGEAPRRAEVREVAFDILGAGDVHPIFVATPRGDKRKIRAKVYVSMEDKDHPNLEPFLALSVGRGRDCLFFWIPLYIELEWV